MNEQSEGRLDLLELSLISVADVAIVRCDRTLFRLVPVIFRSDAVPIVFSDGFS